MRSRQATIVHVRTNLGLVPGVERLGDALLNAGLADGLGAWIAATLAAPEYSEVRDHPSRLLNAEAMVDVARRQADVVGNELDAGRFPIVLGGDDSVLFGSLAALAQRGRYGLVFLDAHTDFYDPADSPTGQASDSEMYLAFGHGPRLFNLDPSKAPLVRGSDSVLIGHRDPREPSETGPALESSGALVITLDEFRAAGIASTAATTLERVEGNDLAGFLIHVDADVLNDEIMPAVDYRLDDGLTHAEFSQLLARLLRSDRAVALDVTIYNPTLDPDGLAAHNPCAALIDASRASERDAEPS